MEIVREEGWRGLYSGVVAALVLCINPSLQFSSYVLYTRRWAHVAARQYRPALFLCWQCQISTNTSGSALTILPIAGSSTGRHTPLCCGKTIHLSYSS